ncbi:hypothetical protein BDR05DRAFT_968422 [Suillus weaverae]|nr:hypothetical protein BDR05DRAFT_968422 [Suillus weaverae]
MFMTSENQSPVPKLDTDSHSRPSRFIVRLGRPFGVFLLARRLIQEDHDIIAQVEDMTSVWQHDEHQDTRGTVAVRSLLKTYGRFSLVPWRSNLYRDQ